MAYITCKHCGCQMSDKSEACPVCGTLVEENSTEIRNTSISSNNDKQEAALENLTTKHRNKVLLIGIALAIVIAITTTTVIIVNNNKEKQAAEQLRIQHQKASEQAKLKEQKLIEEEKQKEEKKTKDLISEIKREILDAYRNGTIHDLMTQDFKSAERNAMEAQDINGIYFDADIFYMTQDEMPDKIDVPEVNLVDNDRAYVKVLLIYNSWDYPIEPILYVVRNKQASSSKTTKWLVDDIVELKGGIVSYSEKASMREFANDAASTIEPEKYVVINANELRLRYGPSLDSQTLRWADGKERYATRGEVFNYLGETDEFYKIDYHGSAFWVSKKFASSFESPH